MEYRDHIRKSIKFPGCVHSRCSGRMLNHSRAVISSANNTVSVQHLIDKRLKQREDQETMELDKEFDLKLAKVKSTLESRTRDLGEGLPSHDQTLIASSQYAASFNDALIDKLDALSSTLVGITGDIALAPSRHGEPSAGINTMRQDIERYYDDLRDFSAATRSDLVRPVFVPRPAEFESSATGEFVRQTVNTQLGEILSALRSVSVGTPDSMTTHAIHKHSQSRAPSINLADPVRPGSASQSDSCTACETDDLKRLLVKLEQVSIHDRIEDEFDGREGSYIELIALLSHATFESCISRNPADTVLPEVYLRILPLIMNSDADLAELIVQWVEQYLALRCPEDKKLSRLVHSESVRFSRLRAT